MKIEFSMDFFKKKNSLGIFFASYFSVVLVLGFLVYCVLFAFYYFDSFNNEFNGGVNNIILGLTYHWSYLVILLIGIFAFFYYTLSVDVRASCVICDKKDYTKDMVALNPKQIKEGVLGRYVCRSHKKPYMTESKPVKYNW